MKDPHCSRCYRGRAIEPRHLCAHHLKLNQRISQKKRQRGICYRCDRPAVRDLVMCSTHAQIRSIDTAIKRLGRAPQRLTRWNPTAAQRVVKLVYETNPYLHRDWSTAEPFIYENYDLWLPHAETAWHQRVYDFEYRNLLWDHRTVTPRRTLVNREYQLPDDS